MLPCNDTCAAESPYSNVTVQTDPGSRPLARRTWPGDSLWAFFCCLDAQNAGVTTLGTGQKFFNDFSELVWISIYAKSLKSLANLAETVQTDPGIPCGSSV